MSVEMVVFLDRARLPSAAAWADAIRDAGFPMELDPEVDVETASGFWPCRYEGVDAGFEFFTDEVRVDDLEPSIARALGGRALRISLVTHSDMRELMTSVIAGLVLASIVDGVFWDSENEITPAKDALERARRFEVETSPLLRRGKRR